MNFNANARKTYYKNTSVCFFVKMAETNLILITEKGMNKFMKTALITGASHGIGKAAARRLAQAGFRLFLNCRTSVESLTSYAKELTETYHVECIQIACDISNHAQVADMFQQIQNAHGSIDVLINNAGISHIGLLQDMSIEEWDRVINTNLTSVFSCCKYAIPHMVEQKQGKIINISSMWGVSGASCEVAYSASKGGVNLFTKALAKELAPSNIQVNAIACGVIDTRMNACFDGDERAELENEIPAGRFAAPEEVAEMILKLVEAPAYLTGQVITFDGGYL